MSTIRLAALRCADKDWSRAGFRAQNNVVRIGDVEVQFVQPHGAGGNEGGLVAWGWTGLPDGVTTLCGVPTFKHESKASEAADHPNGTVSIDHVVLHSNDASFIKQEFAKVGITPRRERNDIYPGITQIFFRPGGGTVIEVVVNEKFPRSNLWGLTVVVSDIDVAKNQLKDNASDPKKAVQPGRKIMTVRHKNLGMATNMAMMTPHVKVDEAKL